MADNVQYVPRRRSPGRATLRFAKTVLTVLAVLAVPVMVVAVAMTPKCKERATRYVVMPSDAHGKLEYCIAEARLGRYTVNGGIWTNFVQPEALCSTAKSELTQRADAMTQASVQARDECQTRAVTATYQMFLAPVVRWFH